MPDDTGRKPLPPGIVRLQARGWEGARAVQRLAAKADVMVWRVMAEARSSSYEGNSTKGNRGGEGHWYVFRASVPASATALDQDTKPIWARSIGAWPIRQFRHALGWWHGPASGSTVRIALQSSFTDRIVRAAGTAPPRRRRSRPQPAHNHRRPPVTARDRRSSTRCHTQAQRHSARTHSLAESQQQPEKAQRKACRRTAAAQQPQGLIAVATHRSMWRP